MEAQVDGLAGFLSNNPFSIAAVLVGAIGTYIRYGASAKRPDQRHVITIVTFIGMNCLAVMAFLSPEKRWLWLLSIIPGGMIFHHGIYLGVMRNRGFWRDGEAGSLAGVDPIVQPLVKAARDEEARYYGPASLSLRYGFPGLVPTQRRGWRRVAWRERRAQLAAV